MLCVRASNIMCCANHTHTHTDILGRLSHLAYRLIALVGFLFRLFAYRKIDFMTAEHFSFSLPCFGVRIMLRECFLLDILCVP